MTWRMSPVFRVNSIERALAFYRDVLGFQVGLTVPGEDGQLVHAELHRGDVAVMFGRGGPVGSAGVDFYADIADESVDAYHAQVSANGATIVEPPADQFWGDRTFGLVDPDGYRWTFAQHVRDVDFSQGMPPETVGADG